MNKQLILLILVSVFLSCNKKVSKTSEFLNQYDEIRVLSYNTHRNTDSNELKIENDTIFIPGIKPVDNVVLNESFSQKIAEILLSTEKQCVMADCYNPRHIILFYKKNKIVGFYEFCAECGGSRQSKNMNLPEFCRDKGDKLIKMFKEMKLKNNGEVTADYPYF